MIVLGESLPRRVGVAGKKGKESCAALSMPVEKPCSLSRKAKIRSYKWFNISFYTMHIQGGILDAIMCFNFCLK